MIALGGHEGCSMVSSTGVCHGGEKDRLFPYVIVSASFSVPVHK
jgi:hypothetical protein